MSKSLKDYASLPRKYNMVSVRLKAETFARVYLEKRNVTEAAIACGYSPRNAAKQGSRFLRHPYVQNAIAKQTLPAYTPDSLRQRLADIIAQPDSQNVLVKAVELAMREKSMLVEKTVNENRNTELSKDLSNASTPQILQELQNRLRLSATGVQTSKSVQIEASEGLKTAQESSQDQPGEAILVTVEKESGTKPNVAQE